MLYSEIKTNFQSILNRRDITASQITTFMGFAIQRIQRELRVPPMEKLVAYTCDGTATLDIPGDLLEVIAIFFNDSVNQLKLTRVDLTSAIRASQAPGVPQVYHRSGASFLIGPYPPSGTKAYINYYADASTLNADTNHNWLTDAAPDLLIYGALCYAADYFLDERKMAFEQRFGQIIDDLQQQAHQDELENASLLPAYNTSPIPYLNPSQVY